ncbi:hypothetical protein [Nocardia sp. NPDC004415]
MKQGMTVGVAVAGGAFAVLVTVAAPHVAAQEVVPGIDCTGFSCTNSTDDPYRVDAVVMCTEGASSEGHVWIPARQSTTVAIRCPSVTKLGTPEPPRWELQSDGTYGYTYPGPPAPEIVQTFAMSVSYRGAEVDHTPPPTLSSGS